MPVSIKLLKGFENSFNNEESTLSLLVKSDYELNEHLAKSKKKLVISLTRIINHLNEAPDIYFYHKVGTPFNWRAAYSRTRYYKISTNYLERDIDDSFKVDMK